MPSESEINKMRDQLFGGIDEEDGLDKAFEAIQSMRGRCAFAYLFVVIVFLNYLLFRTRKEHVRRGAS